MGKYHVQAKIPGYDEDSDLGGWRDIKEGAGVTKRKAYSLAKKYIDQNPDKHVQIIVPEQLEFYQSATP